MPLGPSGEHPDANEIAAYVDGGLAGDARRNIQAHLAGCSACRTEVVEVGRVVRSRPALRSRSRMWIPASAAAAIALVWVVPGVLRDAEPVRHRDEAVTMTPAPRPISPVGSAESPLLMRWSSVPTADRYRVRVFDPSGTMLWERETADTLVRVAASVSLRRGGRYYWKVESHSGFDRWASSDLVEFVP